MGEGESIEMKCRLEEDYEEGEVQMTWFFEDQQIEAGDKYHITFDGTYATLFIAACTMEDMGSFRVLFENKNGTDETTGKVTVKPADYSRKSKPVEKKVEEASKEPAPPPEKKMSYKE